MNSERLSTVHTRPSQAKGDRIPVWKKKKRAQGPPLKEKLFVINSRWKRENFIFSSMVLH